MKQIYLVRSVLSALFTAVVAGTWDVWWHTNMGRDSFWEPPHILLYGSVTVAIAGGVYGWRLYQSKVWKRIAATLCLILIAAPFDELWHRTFGVEPVSSPIIVWSPPHLLLILSLVLSFAMLLPALQEEKDAHARRVFGAMAFAAILSLLLFALAPIQPTGPFALLGFWGAGPTAFVMVLVYLLAQKWIGGFGPTFTFALFVLMLTAIEFGEGSATENTAIVPHDHLPAWLTAFSILLPAIAIDVMDRFPLPVRGAVAGFFCCGLVYGFSWMFFAPEFVYSLQEGAIALASGTLGGLLAGVALHVRSRRTLSE